jgi:hypothetical protein
MRGPISSDKYDVRRKVAASFGVIVLLLQIDTVGLQKAFYDNYLEILRFVSHDPFFADWYAWPRLRNFRS